MISLATAVKVTELKTCMLCMGAYGGYVITNNKMNDGPGLADGWRVMNKRNREEENWVLG